MKQTEVIYPGFLNIKGLWFLVRKIKIKKKAEYFYYTDRYLLNL
jgi:hypothetical protein